MRKSIIICDCCGAETPKLNQVSAKSEHFTRNYELCDDCMGQVISILTQFENEQRLSEAQRDDPLEDAENSIFDDVQD